VKVSKSATRGIALIAVLWLVAAMSLIAAGIVQSVRGEVRTVGLQRHALGATALGDAAILLALQTLQAQPQAPSTATQSVGVEFEGGHYEVLVESLNGRIDINSAPITLLAALYAHIGGLDQKAALALAQATLDTRELKNSKGAQRKFDAVEDLLAVPQMTYDLYAKLTGLITADVIGGSGRVNPKAAPLGVLLVLAGGNAARAGDFAAQRELNPNLMDTSFFDPAHIEASTSPSLRLQVTVGLQDGASVVRAWHVYWGTDPRSGLPWRVLAQSKPVVRLFQPAG
jgi:general secretion pathway protein K